MDTKFKLPSIQLGDYIIIQRQKYTKLQKFSNLNTTVMLGKEQLELRELYDKPYGSTFKMCTKEAIGSRGRRQRLHTLQLVSDQELRNLREVLGISVAGADNRNTIDDSDSQALKPEDIEQLREDCENESSKIIEKIVENSKTFHEKTEYAQEKYLKKKEKKYFEFLQVHRPTVRLIQEIYFRQDPDKVMGLRVDTLSQILSYSDVSAFGNFLLYESGTNGLLPACIIDCMGANTEANLVHMHPGNEPAKQAILAMNFPQEQLERCISVNIYSVLREYYQGDRVAANGDETKMTTMTTTTTITTTAATTAEKSEETDLAVEDEEAPKCKKLKLEENSIESTTEKICESTVNEIKVDQMTEEPIKTPQWKLENKRAVELMHSKFDSLIICAKEHPSSIINELLPLLRPSRPFVVFSQCKETLTELYLELKSNSKTLKLHVISNWMRWYQILPNRTHPEVMMHGDSGYFLTGYTMIS